MKHVNGKILLSLLGLFFLFGATPLRAQIERGSHLIGAIVEGDFLSFSGASNVNVDIAADLQYAYFVRDGLALGAKMPFSYGASGISDPLVWGVSLGFSPFVQWYPGEQTSNVKWFVFAESGFRSTIADIFLPNQTPNIFRANFTEWTSGGGVGLNAFLTPNLALTGIVSGLYSLRLNNGLRPESASVNFNFGVQVFLPTKL
ncbi:MAG: hypothetical protein AAFN10_13970 [Bacteroidota bacterium]